MKKGEKIELDIKSLTHGGDGIGRFNDMAIFVTDTVAGDFVEAEIISVKKSYAKARLVKIITPSNHRVKPNCDLTHECGGCQWQHIDYAEQLRAKKQNIIDNIRRTYKSEANVLDVLASEQTFAYRCKAQLPVQPNKISDGLSIGYFQKGTHLIVDAPSCPIHPDIINQMNGFIKLQSKELRLSAYDKKSKQGLIRHLIYQYSQSQEKVLLSIVINSKNIPIGLRQLCLTLKERFPALAGVIINFNIGENGHNLGKYSKLIDGKGHIIEELSKARFKISASSFFQVNPLAAEKMLDIVYEMIAAKTNNPTVLDVYAGVSTFSIWIENLCQEITAVEENPHAVKDAKENIKIKGAAQKIKIVRGKAGTTLEKLNKDNKSFDVVILDPPRKGCSKKVLQAIPRLCRQYLIYISCDPAVLARDIQYLHANGFILDYVQPVDMFPHTYHVESIALLKKV